MGAECEPCNEVTETVPVGEIMGSFHGIRAGTSNLQSTSVMFISLLKVRETTACHKPFSAGCIVMVRLCVCFSVLTWGDIFLCCEL